MEKTDTLREEHPETQSNESPEDGNNPIYTYTNA